MCLCDYVYILSFTGSTRKMEPYFEHLSHSHNAVFPQIQAQVHFVLLQFLQHISQDNIEVICREMMEDFGPASEVNKSDQGETQLNNLTTPLNKHLMECGNSSFPNYLRKDETCNLEVRKISDICVELVR